MNVNPFCMALFCSYSCFLGMQAVGGGSLFKLTKHFREFRERSISPPPLEDARPHRGGRDSLPLTCHLTIRNAYKARRRRLYRARYPLPNLHALSQRPLPRRTRPCGATSSHRPLFFEDGALLEPHRALMAIPPFSLSAMALFRCLHILNTCSF
jgi:hypothetical protein